MNNSLAGKKILILVSNGVEESVTSTVQRELIKTSATMKTVGTEAGIVSSWNNNTWGLYFPVDVQIGMALGADFDFLVMPSGARAIQKLSATPHSERIISSFISAGKPMAFLGDAIEILANIGLAKGWKVAAPEKSRAILTTAGAHCTEETVCVDRNLYTNALSSGNLVGDVQDMLAYFAGGIEMKAAA